MTGKKLHYSTVTPQLMDVLRTIMTNPSFDQFALVGGTSLSLRYGHRLSVDIDLFSDALYGSLDFASFENYFQKHYSYFHRPDQTDIVGFGRSYYVGNTEDNSIKIDLFYTDTFIRPVDVIDGIRLASIDDIVAMKIDVVSRGGRKKDFWDIHEMLEYYSIPQMIRLHKERYEYLHDPQEIIHGLTDFTIANEMIDPVCLMGKDWDLIRMDIVDAVENIGDSWKRR